jgi:hypothetical protein
VGVAQIMESDAGKAQPGDLPGEQLADRLGVDGHAVRVGEHRVVGAGRVAVAGLPAPPAFQDVFGAGVEVDASAAGWGLGRHLDCLALDALATASNGEPMGRLLPVTPAQPGELAAA